MNVNTLNTVQFAVLNFTYCILLNEETEFINAKDVIALFVTIVEKINLLYKI